MGRLRKPTSSSAATSWSKPKTLMKRWRLPRGFLPHAKVRLRFVRSWNELPKPLRNRSSHLALGCRHSYAFSVRDSRTNFSRGVWPHHRDSNSHLRLFRFRSEEHTSELQSPY